MEDENWRTRTMTRILVAKQRVLDAFPTWSPVAHFYVVGFFCFYRMKIEYIDIEDEIKEPIKSQWNGGIFFTQQSAIDRLELICSETVTPNAGKMEFCS